VAEESAEATYVRHRGILFLLPTLSIKSIVQDWFTLTVFCMLDLYLGHSRKRSKNPMKSMRIMMGYAGNAGTTN